MESRESLQFGIIPSSIVHELRKHGDWKASEDCPPSLAPNIPWLVWHANGETELCRNDDCDRPLFLASQARADAIEQMEQVVAEQREGMQILPVLAGLLEFLATLQRDTNFKISQSATQMLQTIIGLVGSEIKPHLG